MGMFVQGTLANGVNVESNASQIVMIENVSPIKNESRLGHAGIDLLVIVVLELVPFGNDDDCVGVSDCTDVIELNVEILGSWVVALDFRSRDLGVIDVNLSSFIQQELDNLASACLACIPSVLLKSKSQNSQLLSLHGSVHGLENAHTETLFLELVNINNLLLNNKIETKLVSFLCNSE